MSDDHARSAAAAVPAGARRVDVVGDGALAARLRESLPAPSSTGAPDAIVETTGDPAAIADALRRLDDLGTLVLAGPAPRGPVALDLYADLHVRGLTVVGVAPAEAE